MNNEQPVERIVVGVDQSVATRLVLEFALREAARRRATLDVITAYHNVEYWALAYGMPMPPSDDDIRSRFVATTQELLDEVIRDFPGGEESRLAVRVDARAGSPANVLLDAARGADLLVVGHRGHGGFASMLLGSVSMQCVLHAPCPVTVVRPILGSVTAQEFEAAAHASRIVVGPQF